MPNIRHLPKCPYYQGEANMSIKCEDTYRTFIDSKRRQGWMNKFCDNDWENCRYAQVLNETYERFYEGEEMALKEHEIEALKSEMRGLSTHLGRAKSRIARQQTKIDTLREENERYKMVNEKLVEHRKKLYKELRETKLEFEQATKVMYQQLMELTQLYENRLCYLMATKSDGELREKDVEEWVKDKEFAIHGEGDNENRKWVVVFGKEEEDEQLLDENQEQK